MERLQKQSQATLPNYYSFFGQFLTNLAIFALLVTHRKDCRSLYVNRDVAFS